MSASNLRNQCGRGWAYLELEQLLELLLDLARVAASAPVAGQPVRVRHHLQQRQLRLEGHALLRDEAPADGQHYPQRGCPPASTSLCFTVMANVLTAYNQCHEGYLFLKPVDVCWQC